MFEYTFKITMIDGKMCNAATDTKSTSRCYICRSTCKAFNNVTKKLDGFWILTIFITRLYANFWKPLASGYKLPLKKYGEQRIDEEKELELLIKKNIQERFRKVIELLDDMPTANFGNTNIIETSRWFFENPQLPVDITTVHFELIYKLKFIL